ncbi:MULTISPECIES: AraC family transcriptional regulator [unclassified Bradyrhizobium]|uniref:AraC family transcriptional regulator n=1 Tax=unclassified Bradyrhizobium TaxID=2631580 RepID=UPI0023068F54|nr:MULTISPECIES: AraC family transcriptional regulator [unclassified Bradyrhizobium]MDA9409780.1 transcriptional regulator [Bradyrhizobium sp. CCBAU 45384]MDA9444458.1 transcriptional regulator [Bradyrhizobium sp. CCBAU 51745]
MHATSRRKVDVERLGYRPSKPYPYDLEIFRVTNLKRRTRAEAMRWTYSYEFYMIICVTKGRCVQFVDFEPVSCSEGALLILRPGQAHNFGSDENWDGWIILFRPEFLLPAMSVSQDLRLSFDLERLPHSLKLDHDELKRASDAIVQMRADSLIDTSSRPTSAVSRNKASAAALPADIHALLRFQFYAFATWLAVIHGRGMSLDPQWSAALQRFNRFQKLVEQHFSEWNQLGDYVKELGCTEKSLTRATTIAVGMSAKAFLSQRINLEAKRLLAHTDLPIGEIAEKLGFYEATHFSKFFKRETSCTPREFRLRSSSVKIRHWS